MARSRLHELSEHGVSVWMDTLSRERLETGNDRGMDEDDEHVVCGRLAEFHCDLGGIQRYRRFGGELGEARERRGCVMGKR